MKPGIVVSCSIAELQAACEGTPGWVFSEPRIGIGTVREIISSTEGYSISEVSIMHTTGVPQENVAVRLPILCNYSQDNIALAYDSKEEVVLMSPHLIRALSFTENDRDAQAQHCRRALAAFPDLCEQIIKSRSEAG